MALRPCLSAGLPFSQHWLRRLRSTVDPSNRERITHLRYFLLVHLSRTAHARIRLRLLYQRPLLQHITLILVRDMRYSSVAHIASAVVESPDNHIACSTASDR